jgi:hypothetical protein
MKTWLSAVALLAVGCGGNQGSVEFTASGEVLALSGYRFPLVNPGDPDFVDGWDVTFTKFIAVFDKVTLSQGPDTSASDQSKVGGAPVATIEGPWAIDLHQGGPLSGKGGGDEQAMPIQTIAHVAAGARLAFGFDSVPATASAKLINIDANDPDYAEMVKNGWNVLYVGTAVWNGTMNGNTCTSTNPNYDFSQFAKMGTVNFRFGFSTPTTYVNCQNPDNDPAKALGDEEHERGVQVQAGQTTIAQVTFHTDHPFWESFTHDTPAHFDQLASLAVKQPDGTYLVTLDNTQGVDYTAFKGPDGKPLPWHACDSLYMPPNMNAQMGFDSLSYAYTPSGDPNATGRNYVVDYQDYMKYDQSTQGHLNSDGLCFVQRHYPSAQ